jgi:hypothetical protein
VEYKRIFRLKTEQQEKFAAFPEVFQGVQVGFLTHAAWTRQVCLVIGGLVVVVFQDGLQDELAKFFAVTWRSTIPPANTIVERYEDWLKSLNEPNEIDPVDAVRDFVAFAVSTNSPPPPPNRSSLVPVPPGFPGSGTAVYGHLPFKSNTEDREVFFRWEAWPTSRRILTARNEVVADTFASPHSEVPFIPTGFAAVGRTALPSLFPAVFRYEIKPPPTTPILCGAVVPMFGQSGGGVEVCFTSQFTNQGPIADPIVLAPL